MVALLTLGVVLAIMVVFGFVMAASPGESVGYGQVEPNKSVPVPVREPISGRGDEGEKPGRYL